MMQDFDALTLKEGDMVLVSSYNPFKGGKMEIGTVTKITPKGYIDVMKMGSTSSTRFKRDGSDMSSSLYSSAFAYLKYYDEEEAKKVLLRMKFERIQKKIEKLSWEDFTEEELDTMLGFIERDREKKENI